MSNRANRNSTPKGRNAAAVSAWNRNSAGPMRDRRAQRGGARNEFLDLLDQVEQDKYEERKELQELADAAEYDMYMAGVSAELAETTHDEYYERCFGSDDDGAESLLTDFTPGVPLETLLRGMNEEWIHDQIREEHERFLQEAERQE